LPYIVGVVYPQGGGAVEHKHVMLNYHLAQVPHSPYALPLMHYRYTMLWILEIFLKEINRSCVVDASSA